MKKINEQLLFLEQVLLVGAIKEEVNREKLLSELEANDFISEKGKKIFSYILKHDINGEEINEIKAYTDFLNTIPDIEEYIYDEKLDIEIFKYNTHLKDYKELAKKIKLTSILQKIIKQLPEKNSDEIILDIENNLIKLEKKATNETLIDLSDKVDGHVGNLRERKKTGKTIVGIPTGFEELDYAIGGLRRGNLIILAGKTGSGKSTMALQIAYKVAEKGNPVIYFHQESNEEETLNRLIAQNLDIQHSILEHAMQSDEDEEKIIKFKEYLATMPLRFDFSFGVTIEHVFKVVRRAFLQFGGIGLVVIDHLQFMKHPKAHSRNESIGITTKALLELADKFKTPVLVLSQFNRSADKENRQPKLSDLRDSGEIEQDSHLVLFLETNRKQSDQQKNQARIFIAKNRHKTGGFFIEYKYIPRFVKYEEIKKYY